MAEASIGRARWLAKKGARLAFGLAGTAAGAVRPRPGVRAVTYHRFGPAARMPFTVTADRFEAEMSYLAGTGRAVSLGEVEAHVAGRRRLKDGSVLVTIDDGDPTVARIAVPILARHRIPAVLYALAGEPAGYETMTAAELREAASAGITIGSHTVGHRSLARLEPGDARRELDDSRRRLEDVLGTGVDSLAYPFGTRNDVGEGVAVLAREAGYRTAFTSLHGAIDFGSKAGDALLLPRVKVESGDGGWLFPKLCDGAMDGWRLVDGGLSAWQTPAKAVAAHRSAA